MGVKYKVSLSTFSDANNSRPWHIYYEQAILLIETATKAHSQDDDLKSMSKSIYALNTTTIDLCLSLFPWTEYSQHKTSQ